MLVDNSIRRYTFIRGTNVFPINMKVAPVIVFVVLAQLTYMVVEAKPSSKKQLVQDLIEKKVEEELARDLVDEIDDMDDEELDQLKNDPFILSFIHHGFHGGVRFAKRFLGK